MFSALSGGWSPFNIQGTRIKFHFSTLFSIPIAYYLFKPVDIRGIVEALIWVIGFLSFIFLHELGHMFAAKIIGVEVKSVSVWLLGGFTQLAYKPDKPFHNLIIAAAGPLVNMVLAFLCVAIYILLSFASLPYSSNVGLFLWVQTFLGLSISLAFVNVLLIVFNLLPVFPLDGGNIFHALMELIFGRSRADLITLIVGIPILLLLIVFAVVTHDFIMLGFCILLALSLSTLNRSLLHWISLGINYFFRRPAYYYLQGDYDRAVQIYTRQIEKNPSGAVSQYLARASCYLVMGQSLQAAADVDRVLKYQPNHPVLINLRGEIYALEKKYDAAMELYNRSLNANPHWAIPYFDIGSIQLDLGDVKASLENLNRAISLQARMPIFYLVRSLAHYRLGDMVSAHRDQDHALRLSRKESLVMLDVNHNLYENNLDWAGDFYERILKDNPRDGFALHGYADACRINGEQSFAVELYTRAIKVQPKEPRLYIGRGKSHMKLGQSEQAKADFQNVPSITNIIHLKRQSNDLLRTVDSQLQGAT